MRRAALIAVALVALALPAPAAAVPLLDSADATELAQSLADATAQQGVCYGWRVTVDDQYEGMSGIDTGSNAGPRIPANADGRCRRTVLLTGTVTYTCASCEAEDSSSVSLTSFPGGPSRDDLSELGLRIDDLHAEDGDAVLANLVGALPLVTASKGAAAPVAGDVNRAPIPRADRATSGPSSPDWLRESWPWLVLCLMVIAAGAVLLVGQFIHQPPEKRRPPSPSNG